MSRADDDKRQISVFLDARLKDAAEGKLEHGERSELVRELYRRVASGGYDDHTVLDVLIDNERERVRSLKDERKELHRELERLDGEIEDAEETVDHYQRLRDKQPTEHDQYLDALEVIEQRLRGRGTYYHPQSAEVVSIAESFGMDPEEVHEHLRERNPDVPDEAFSEFDPDTEREWYGFDDDEKISAPLDQRDSP